MKTDEELLAEIAADSESGMTINDPTLIKVYQESLTPIERISD